MKTTLILFLLSCYSLTSNSLYAHSQPVADNLSQFKDIYHTLEKTNPPIEQETQIKELTERLGALEDLNTIYKGHTLLSLAAKKNLLPIVSYLINIGANIQQELPSQNSALIHAIIAGNDKVVNLLLNSGARLEHENQFGFAAFDWALEYNRKSIMEQLIKSRLKHLNLTNALTQQWSSPPKNEEIQSLLLIHSIITKNSSRLDALLNAGFNPNHHNFSGYAPLPLSVRLNYLEGFEYLIRHKADINIGNNGNDEASPINQAARAASLLWLKKTIVAGAEVNKPNARGYRALHIASARGCYECVNYLIEQGADSQLEAERNFKAIDFAIQRNHKKTALRLILEKISSRNFDVIWRLVENETSLQEFTHSTQEFSKNTISIAALFANQVSWFSDKEELEQWFDTPTYGYFPLNYAVLFSNDKMVSHLVDLNAPVSRAAKSGYHTTPLIDATRNKGRPSIVKLLLKKGADALKADRFGDAPINWATFYKNKSIVMELLQAGADPLQLSEKGYTALKTAEEAGSTEIVKIIKTHINQSNKVYKLSEKINSLSPSQLVTELKKIDQLDLHTPNGDTLLIQAIKASNYQLVQTLLDMGASPDKQSRDGYKASPLMISVTTDDIQISRILLNAGAPVDQLDVLGDGALNWAVYMGKSKMVDLLLSHKADPYITSPHGNALDIATRLNHSSIIQKLFPLFEKKIPKSSKQFVEAVLKKDIPALNQLLKSTRGLVIKDELDNSLLSIATNNNCIACAEKLLQENQEVDQGDRIGFSPLMIAIRNNDQSLFDLLIKYGANVNYQATARGMKLTPAIVAANYGRTEMLDKLLRQGIELTNKDIFGNTALHWAAYSKNSPIIERLKQYGADDSVANKFGKTAEKILSL